MKLTVLVDNNTLIDRYFLAEPALSLLIEDKETSVLFDTGYSDLFLKNAIKMEKDLSNLDYLVLSHSHLDHTWGLEPFIRFLSERSIEGQAFKAPALIAHPEVFESRRMGNMPELGALMTPEKLTPHLAVQLSKEPVRLTDRLTFLGQIPRIHEFEGHDPSLGDVLDDSALVYHSPKGLVIITGCAHAGICNTIAYAQNICNEDRVVDVIGGFHLLDPPMLQIKMTVDYFRRLDPDALHACHCTDLNSKIALARVAPVKETGVGTVLEYE